MQAPKSLDRKGAYFRRGGICFLIVGGESGEEDHWCRTEQNFPKQLPSFLVRTWSKSVTKGAEHQKDQDYHWEFEESSTLRKLRGCTAHCQQEGSPSWKGLFGLGGENSDAQWPETSGDLGQGKDL